jgi:rhodanese-related sulfurtransferase
MLTFLNRNQINLSFQKQIIMKKYLNYFIVFLIVPALFLGGCKQKDDDNPTVEKGNFNTLKTYLIENTLDLPDMLNGWIVSAEGIHDKLGDYHIMDIRSAADFENGHIDGAVNTTLANIVNDAKDVTKQIVVVCYTGQTASHAVIALRLSGHPNAQVLKWGMSGWNEVFAGPWNSNVGNTADDYPNNWVTDATATPKDFEYPGWETTTTDGAEILKERVNAFLQTGFHGITSTDVLTAPSDYFINNYWAQADVDHYGHIKGAYRIKEDLSLAGGGIKKLDPSKTIVTYCWTGQTSSMVTAYLAVLGYNTKSLKFGTNAMIHDKLESHKWGPGAIMDYEYVTGK